MFHVETIFQIKRKKIFLIPLLVLTGVFLLIHNEVGIRSHFTYREWWTSWDLIPRDNANESETTQQIDTDYFTSLMQRRIRHLRNSCEKILNATGSTPATLVKLGSVSNNATGIVWYRELGIAWCPVPKAASSSWKDNLQRFNNSVTVSPSMHEWEHFSSGASSNFTLFIIARHPFHRLVSAYRQKFESGKLKGIGKVIVDEFRKKATLLGHKPRKELFLASEPPKITSSKLIYYPTFWEFAQAVLTNKNYFGAGIHWFPIYAACSLCQPLILSTLNYILKFEHLFQEEKLFIHDRNWGSVIQTTSHKNVYNERHDLNVTKIYFETLDRDSIDKLYEKFKPDFQLFNYTFSVDDWTS